MHREFICHTHCIFLYYVLQSIILSERVMEWASGNVEKIANSLHAVLRGGGHLCSQLYIFWLSTWKTDHVDHPACLAMELATQIVLKWLASSKHYGWLVSKARKTSCKLSSHNREPKEEVCLLKEKTAPQHTQSPQFRLTLGIGNTDKHSAIPPWSIHLYQRSNMPWQLSLSARLGNKLEVCLQGRF